MAKIGDIAILNPVTGSVYSYTAEEESPSGDWVFTGYAYLISQNQMINSVNRVTKSVLDTVQYQQTVTNQATGETLNYLYTDYAPVLRWVVVSAIVGLVFLLCLVVVRMDGDFRNCMDGCLFNCQSQGTKMKKATKRIRVIGDEGMCDVGCTCECG